MAETLHVEAIPEVVDLRLHQGDTFTLTLTFQGNVASSTFAAQVRPTTKSATFWNFAVDTSQAASGIVVLTLSAANTAAMPATAVWDLQETKAGVVTTLLKGRVRVGRETTR